MSASSTVPGETRRRTPRGALAPAAVLLVLAVVVPLVVAAATGALGLPRNDDWSYSDLLWRWQETGDLLLGGWESMTLLGQLLLAWPVGELFPREPAALQWSTTLLGAAGALAAFGALRTFLDRGRALLAVAVTLLSPLYAPLAVSFMTDVPSFAVQAVCLWAASRALVASSASSSRAWFAASVAVGLFAVTIREYAVVAPAAVLLVFGLRAWGRGERTDRRLALALGAASVLFVGAFVAWRRSWADSLSLDPSVPGGLSDGASSFGRSVTFTVVTLTFLVLPLLAFVDVRGLARRMTASRWGLVASISAVVILLAGALTTWELSPPLLGPYLDQRGALGNDILPGDRALLLPRSLLALLLAVTLVATVLLVGLLVLTAIDAVRRAPTWSARCAAFDGGTLAWVVVVLTVVSLTVAGTAELPIFDRYVLPAVPFAAGLVLARGRSDGVSLAARGGAGFGRWTAVAAFAALGLVWTVDAARFDAARWHAGESAVRAGYPADRVDAGFEWRNVHRPAGDAPMSPSQRDLDACARLAAPGADLGPGWVPLFTVEHWHGTGEGALTLWVTEAPGCPPL